MGAGREGGRRGHRGLKTCGLGRPTRNQPLSIAAPSLQHPLRGVAAVPLFYTTTASATSQAPSPLPRKLQPVSRPSLCSPPAHAPAQGCLGILMQIMLLGALAVTLDWLECLLLVTAASKRGGERREAMSREVRGLFPCKTRTTRAVRSAIPRHLQPHAQTKERHFDGKLCKGD